MARKPAAPRQPETTTTTRVGEVDRQARYQFSAIVQDRRPDLPVFGQQPPPRGAAPPRYVLMCASFALWHGACRVEARLTHAENHASRQRARVPAQTRR